jgi:hypothetical protein
MDDVNAIRGRVKVICGNIAHLQDALQQHCYKVQVPDTRPNLVDAGVMKQLDSE